MSAVTVDVVHPDDDDAFDAWFRTGNAARENPFEPDWLPQELRARARRDLDERTVLLLARLDGDPAGTAMVTLPLRDNQHVAWAERLLVLPSCRRRGVGSALEAAVERVAREAGRTSLAVEHTTRDDLGGAEPARAFATRRGYAPALVEARRDLALPVGEEHLARLEEEARALAGGYALRTWWDRVPEDLLDARAELAVRMSVDAPVGDLDWHQEVWDADRVRRRDDEVAEQGRTYVGVIAVHEASGRAVGFCEVGVPRAAPERGYQWETLVVGDHRGHRIGLLMKVATTREVQSRSPQTRYLSTWNAEVNAPMIAVNEQLGYRRVGTLTEWQRRLA